MYNTSVNNISVAEAVTESLSIRCNQYNNNSGGDDDITRTQRD